MNKKIIFILLGGLLILALIFLLWFWFFGRNKSEVLPNTGSFGTAQDAGNAGADAGSSGNGQAPIGTGVGSTVGNTGGSGGSGAGGGGGGQTTTPDYLYTSGTTSGQYFSNPSSGAIWFTGGFGGGGSANNFRFTQTPINDFGDGTVSGSPYITTIVGADGSDISLLSSLATVIGGCLVQYGIEQLAIAPVVRAEDTATGIIGNIFGNFLNFLFPGTGIGDGATTQSVSDSTSHVKETTGTVTECLTRTLGRLAVQKITESTVNWINSGFDGKPAYVQDFGKFFSDVADNAAGDFIQGSGLAFLCSPFQLQVKIAIAQSYANSRSGSASSCTLSGIKGNVDQFLKGDFSQGGWNGFLQFTTVPANNPYAGYVQGQLALNNAISYDRQNATLTISPGGFLSQQQCTTDLLTGKKTNCKVVTPGSVIEDSLHATFQSQLDSLQLGESFDQILSALSNALITKVLYGGLTNANQANASDSNPATTKAQRLMNEIQASVTAAQQYASIKQRSIADIQVGQQNLAVLGNCWAHATSTPGASPAAIAAGTDGFNNVVSTLSQLQAQIEVQNNKIAAANTSITRLQSMQTDLLLATVPGDVTSVETQLAAFKTANNPRFYIESDTTAATQDRQTLQSQMAGINQNTSAQLTQCYALSQ